MTPDMIAPAALQFCLCRKPETLAHDLIDAFENFWSKVQQDGPDMSYDLPYPKMLFLDYLSQHKALAFHGSVNSTLRTLTPIRFSSDDFEFGKKEMIFATPIPEWAVWFAILDKTRAKGTSSGALYRQSRKGETYIVSWFAFDRDATDDHPYNPGMLYVLPVEPFTEREREQWGSLISVEPLMRLPVEPSDFPYLSYVRRYDSVALRRQCVEHPQQYSWLADAEVFPVSPPIPKHYHAKQVI